jgi:hypothetical protein
MFSVALLAGAILGGWTAKRLKFVKPDLTSAARSFIGSAMMGAGSALIPGGNDALILVGIPLLWPYAWLAFASICVTIFVGSVMARLASAHMTEVVPVPGYTPTRHPRRTTPFNPPSNSIGSDNLSKSSISLSRVRKVSKIDKG